MLNTVVQYWASVPARYKQWTLMGLSTLFLIGALWHIMIAMRTLPLVVQRTVSVPPLAPVNMTKTAPLFTRPIFGIYEPVLTDKDIKQSMLSLEIVGIMYASRPQDSQVVIKAADGDEQTYVIGDELPGGAVVKKITASGIVVLYNGELERLSLPKSQLNFVPPDKPLQ